MPPGIFERSLQCSRGSAKHTFFCREVLDSMSLDTVPLEFGLAFAWLKMCAMSFYVLENCLLYSRLHAVEGWSNTDL